MKKLFTLTLFALGLSLTTSLAQVKKTWDFTQGVSEETIADLDADANWNVTRNDDGSFKQANEATKLSGPFKANGNIIKELAGLSLGTAGLQKNNNVILMPNRFRINRDKMELIFPKLVNGQTITIVGRSANASAENRGIKAAYDYMQRIAGPEDNLIKASLGEVTNKWQVVTDETDSVDIKFVMITGGIDFTLFMIDEGDVASTTKVAYLYDGTDDAVLTALKADTETEVTPVNVTTETVSTESLQAFDVTVVGPNMPAGNAAVEGVKTAMPWTPVLNLNAGIYAEWGYGTPTMTSPFAKITNTKHKLFKDVELVEEEDISALPITEGEAAPAVVLGDYFADDEILAVTMEDDDATMIHTHNPYHNGYIFIPYTEGFTTSALEVVKHAITMLKDSKAEITAATAPTLSRIYKDQQTQVIIKAPNQPKAQVYYTIDGSEPTLESTLYTDTLCLTQACTVKAVAIAEGYTLSNSASLEVLIKSQPKAPVIAAEMEEGKTIIKLSCETEDVKIWYNFNNVVDTTKSSVYADTIPVFINMPQNVTAFATAGEPGEAVFSEVTTQRVLVWNPRVVIDVAGHFRAAKWDDVSNGAGLFAGGKNATSMYDASQEPIGYEEDPETGDQKPIYPEVEWATRDEAGDAPEWTVMTKGQAVLWQNLTAQTGQIGTDEGGYYPSIAEDIDPLFPITSYDIQFSKIYGGEHANAAIQSKNTYKAPLDIVVIANMQGGPLLAQVSADGINWTTVGEEIAKTGYKRMWKKYTRMYEGTDEVYVRVAQETGGEGCKIFDIYVANQGEQSQALLEQLNNELAAGISEVQVTAQQGMSGIYSLSGARMNGLKRGLNIVVDGNGQARKVLVK